MAVVAKKEGKALSADVSNFSSHHSRLFFAFYSFLRFSLFEKVKRFSQVGLSKPGRPFLAERVALALFALRGPWQGVNGLAEE